MKVAVVFTGSGPILIFTTYASFGSLDFIEKLEAKGLNKFIAYEVPVELAKKKYGDFVKLETPSPSPANILYSL